MKWFMISWLRTVVNLRILDRCFCFRYYVEIVVCMAWWVVEIFQLKADSIIYIKEISLAVCPLTGPAFGCDHHQ